MLSSNLCDQHFDGGWGARTQSEASKENRGLRASSRFITAFASRHRSQVTLSLLGAFTFLCMQKYSWVANLKFRPGRRHPQDRINNLKKLLLLKITESRLVTNQAIAFRWPSSKSYLTQKHKFIIFRISFKVCICPKVYLGMHVGFRSLYLLGANIKPGPKMLIE